MTNPSPWGNPGARRDAGGLGLPDTPNGQGDRRSQAGVDPSHPARDLYDTDPELEIWIDHGAFPVSVCLAGVVDRATGATLLEMLEDLLVGGATHFVLDLTDTVIFASGVHQLELCRRRSQEAGGSLVLKGVEFPEQFHQENLARWASGQTAPTT